MAEKVHQTWTRITGKSWGAARAGGYTSGSYGANIALQKKLMGGWNPYAAPSPTKLQTPSTPPPDTPVSRIAAATTAYQSQLKKWEDLEKQSREAREAQQTEMKGWYAKLKKSFEQKTPTAEMLKTEREKWGIPKQYEQLKAYVGEIEEKRKSLTALETQEAEMLMATEQKLAPMTFIRGEQALVQRQFAVKKTAIAADIAGTAATMEAIQGNIAVGQNLVSEMVAAATYDYERRVSDISNFISLNQSIIADLKQDERQAMTVMLGAAEKELEDAKKEKELLGQIMLQYPEAGVKWNMTLDQAYELASSTQAQLARTERAEEKRRWEAGYALEAGRLGLSREQFDWQKEQAGGEPQDIEFLTDLAMGGQDISGMVDEKTALKVMKEAERRKKDPKWVMEYRGELRKQGYDEDEIATMLGAGTAGRPGMGIGADIITKTRKIEIAPTATSRWQRWEQTAKKYTLPTPSQTFRTISRWFNEF